MCASRLATPSHSTRENIDRIVIDAVGTSLALLERNTGAVTHRFSGSYKMRRLLATTILGALLATPTFAADNDTNKAQTPALTIAPATVAAAAATANNDTAAAPSSDFKPYNFNRPSLLPALYAGAAALQAYDTYSTLTALKNGGTEANPFMQSVVKSPAAFVALKAGMTTASIMAAENLWKNNHRWGAVGMMVASNVMMGIVAAHNSRVLATLR
jgi:hypothetical protein